MFNLTLDFDEQTLSGTVTHLLNKKDLKVQIVSFDAKNLNITRVQYKGSDKIDLWRGTTFNVTEPDPVLGSAVSVNVSSHYSTDDDIYIRFHYSVLPTSEAVLWLQPNQTAEGTSPLVYTQCKDIMCRQLAPMQDTPAIRANYSARIDVST